MATSIWSASYSSGVYTGNVWRSYTLSLSAGTLPPSGATINKVQYYIGCYIADGESGKNWQLHGIAVENGPYTGGAYSTTSAPSAALSPGVVYYGPTTTGNFQGGTCSRGADLHGRATLGLYACNFVNNSNTPSFNNSTINTKLRVNAAGSGTTYVSTIAIEVTYNETQDSGGSGSIGGNTSYPQSTITSSSATFGGTCSVSINNYGQYNRSHTLTFSIPGSSKTSGEIYLGEGVTQYAYAIPQFWAEECPNSTSGTLEIKLVTTGFSVYGSKATVTVTVPQSMVPTINTLTTTIHNDKSPGAYATNHNQYLQSLTGVKITANASGAYGSTIQNYSLVSNTREVISRQDNNIFQIDQLKSSGSIVFTCTATDSRGRTATKTTSINVNQYGAPQILSCSAIRCIKKQISSGVFEYIPSDSGRHIAIKIIASVSSINGTATMTINSYYYKGTSSSNRKVARSDMASGETYYIDPLNITDFDIDNTWYILFQVTDSAGNRTTKDIRITTQSYALHVRRGGDGVAFGKTCENSNTVQINDEWSLTYKGFTMPCIYASSIEPTNPVNGMIWIELK